MLMLQGSMSSVGKSLLVAGLCRLYARRGYHVAPFKAQNMSNNAAVCMDGAEIGRSQYTQALACGIDSQAAMNPVLLKPEADSDSQVIVMGKPYATLPAREYYKHKNSLWKVITGALDTLREAHDLVIMEGAGSPVELNLKSGDMVNMAIAKYAKAPVLLIGDIDRGGVFSQLLGTLWLLDDEERQLVQGLLINKFRGDISLFSDGRQMLQERSGVPVLGVIPHIHHTIPEEDAVSIEAQNTLPKMAQTIDIAIIRFPRIANFDDFDPLVGEMGVGIRYIDSPEELQGASAIILPGTKSTLADMAWLRSQGLDQAIRQFALDGGVVVGICGGYQMLGQKINDPEHVESTRSEADGLGLLEIETTFEADKSTYQIHAEIHTSAGWMADMDNDPISGYEIHMGETHLLHGDHWLTITQRGDTNTRIPDGAVSKDGKVWGCYIHGIFQNDSFRRAWLRSLCWEVAFPETTPSLEASFDHLADVLETAIDMDRLDAIIGLLA